MKSNELIVTLKNPNSQASEQYRKIRTHIEFASVDQPLKKINVTSSLSNEAKTTTACNLAFMFANKPMKVLLIDADLRNPSVYQTLGLKVDKGITDLIIDYSRNNFLIDNIDLNQYIVTFEHENLIESVDVLNAGSRVTNPAEFIGSKAFKKVIQDLSNHYDLLIIDSAPSGFIVDGIITSTIVDGTIFVMEYGKNRFDTTKETINDLKRAGVNIIGGIISKAPVRNDFYSRYYNESYYYAIGGEKDE